MRVQWIQAKHKFKVQKRKSKNAQEVLDRLQAYLESSAVTGEPVNLLCSFWKDQQDAITYKELREAVIEGYVSDEILQEWSHDYSVLVANQMQNIWIKAMKAGPLGQPLLDGSFFELNTQTPGIMNWISQRGAEFVTNCSFEQTEAISALLSKKMRDSHTVDELARMTRPCIGLTKAQAAANAKYYDNIVSSLRKEHPRMDSKTIKTRALDASRKYAERQHRQRAMMIAQTESAYAYNRGADEGIRQAQDLNLIGIVKKKWSTSGDESVCEICSALEGTEIGLDENFDFKGKILFAGQRMLPPAHPRCACAVEYVEVEKPKEYYFEAPIDELVQNYEEIVLDTDDIRSDYRNDELIVSTKISSSKNELYLSDNAKLKRRQLHEIDTGITEALDSLNIKNLDNIPKMIIVSENEINKGTLAAYNPYKNIMYINENAGKRKVLLQVQEDYAASDKDYATYVHELIHWMDAEEYRKFNKTIDEKYKEWLNRKCKKILDEIGKSGYDLTSISEYAEYSFVMNKFDEVYTEFRVKVILGE